MVNWKPPRKYLRALTGKALMILSLILSRNPLFVLNNTACKFRMMVKLRHGWISIHIFLGRLPRVDRNIWYVVLSFLCPINAADPLCRMLCDSNTHRRVNWRDALQIDRNGYKLTLHDLVWYCYSTTVITHQNHQRTSYIIGMNCRYCCFMCVY